MMDGRSVFVSPSRGRSLLNNRHFSPDLREDLKDMFYSLKKYGLPRTDGTWRQNLQIYCLCHHPILSFCYRDKMINIPIDGMQIMLFVNGIAFTFISFFPLFNSLYSIFNSSINLLINL